MATTTTTAASMGGEMAPILALPRATASAVAVAIVTTPARFFNVASTATFPADCACKKNGTPGTYSAIASYAPHNSVLPVKS